MAIAKGSKSKLVFKEETTYGTAPSGNWIGVPITSETLDEQIDKIMASDIRPDRTTPAIRGGNIAAGGQISCDFGVNRHFTFIRHAMASAYTAPGAATTVTALSAATVTRGSYATANSKLYVCKIGGVVTAGDVTTSLTHTSGEASLTNTTWIYVGASSTLIYTHSLAGGVDFPTGGLSFEKQIIGTGTPLYVAFFGGRVNSWNISIPDSGTIKTTFDLLFKRPLASASTLASTPSYTTVDDPAVSYEAMVSMAAGADQPIREANITLANNCDENARCIQSRDRREIPEGTRILSGRLSTYFEDRTFYDAFKNETEVTLDFSVIRGGNYFDLNLGEVKLTGSGTPKISGQGIIQADFDFTAYKQDGSNDVTQTLINQLASM